MLTLNITPKIISTTLYRFSNSFIFTFLKRLFLPKNLQFFKTNWLFYRYNKFIEINKILKFIQRFSFLHEQNSVLQTTQSYVKLP